ncbi:hypothetical protein EES43_29825 [Streptomyces sp. ADI96-02]|uniref:DUF3732 domain-containing protein n=1 Tax=unclassified Streptomyces TaxID=2593676 RepID=UPI000F551EFC|nr:DUF3732 domain-containing protein [Streptomyces sp. ADI96-02]RPK54001.1 hypothetical protein EES43_29825 [Streptomyces sp. ADI96-02]
MHLLALALYHRDGRPDPRVVHFRPGALNILTGESETGKSAVLGIVEYCLGRQTFTLPDGVITNTTGWYALLVQIGPTRLVLGRPAPKGASTNKAMLVIGDHTLTLPTASHLNVNADATALRAELSARIGIEDFRFQPPPGAGRHAFDVSISQAALLCLQKQNEIANQTLLFHRQGEPGIAQAIKDTLPYFLGAAGPEQAARRHELAEIKKAQRRISKLIEEARRRVEGGEAHRIALARMAADAGMIAEIPEAVSAAALDQLLHRALEAVPDVPSLPGQDSRRDRLAAERRELRSQLQELTNARGILDTWNEESTALTGELHTQLSRLKPIGLLAAAHPENAGSDTCPVCSQQLPFPDPDIGDLESLTRRLDRELDDLAALQPARNRHREELDGRSNEIQARLRNNAATLDAINTSDRQLRQAQDQRTRLAHIQGRILQELQRTTPLGKDELADLHRNADRLNEQAEALQLMVDADEVGAETENRLNEVADLMTTWARTLDLEHADTAEEVRISPSLLNVVLRTPDGRRPLTRIGSAKNWIGYHLVAHLALHTYLNRHNRPVPGFLMLDQPTQAFFPEEVHDADTVLDADWEAVRAYFSLISQAVSLNEGALQVIVCDHVNLRDDWFREAVVENWRGGTALIPTDWITEA